MGSLVIVGPSDHLAKIAARHGVRDPERVWNDPANAELRARRGNPHVLLAGDEVFVPDPDPPSFGVPAGRRHGFRMQSPPLELRCRLLDVHGDPRGDTVIEALVDAESMSLTTDGDGVLVVPIRSTTEQVRLRMDDGELELTVGRLDPIDTAAGLRARLAGLGYLAGELDGSDPEELAFAISLFQHDQGLPIDGRIDDVLRDALTQVFGT
jgi:Putative peptidoglycan binding domain